MKKFTVLMLVISTILFTGCFFTIFGSGNLITETRSFTDFDTVIASDAVNIAVVYGAVYSVSITTDDNIMPYINVYKSVNSLYCRISNPSMQGISYTHLQIAITMPLLKKLSVNDASDANIIGFTDLNDFTLEAHDASDVDLKQSTIKTGTFTVSDASDVWLTFSVDSTAVFTVSDASDVWAVFSNTTVSGRLTDASTLYYRGIFINNSLTTSDASEIKTY